MIDTFVLWAAIQSTPLAVDFLSPAFITLILLTLLALLFLVGGFILWLRVSRARAANTRTADDSVFLRRRSVNPFNIVIPALLGIGLIVVFLYLPPAPTHITQTPTSTPTRHTPTPTPIVAPPPPSDLFAPGMLTVGSNTSYPPQEYLDANNNNKPTGFDIALITAMAEKMGLKVKVIPTQFTDLFSNLNNNQLDVVISALAISPENQQATFIPYLKSVESFMSLKSNANGNSIKKLTDLCGKKVGVLSGSSAETDLKKTNCGNNKIAISSQKDTISIVESLKNAMIDVAYLDAPVASYYMNQKQYKPLFAVSGSFTEDVQEGIGVRLGDDAMLTAMMKAFQAVQNDKNKTYKNLLGKWGFTSEDINTP